MKEPHYTHTDTHRVTSIHTEMRAKQTEEGGDRAWWVLALGGLWSSNRDGASFKEWPQRSGLHKDKEGKQNEYTTHPISFMTAEWRWRKWFSFNFSEKLNSLFFLWAPDCLWCRHAGSLHHSQKPDNLSSVCVCLPTSESAQKPVPLLFSHSQHTSREREPVCGEITKAFISHKEKKNNPVQYLCNICVGVLYLGLFIHIPGEGDGIVGNFFNVANCVEALLVIGCGDKQGHGLILQSHTPQKQLFPA